MIHCVQQQSSQRQLNGVRSSSTSCKQINVGRRFSMMRLMAFIALLHSNVFCKPAALPKLL